MSDLTDIQELTPELKDWAKAVATGAPVARSVEELFPGESKGFYDTLRKGNLASYHLNTGEERFVAADISADGKVMAVAAAIPRNAGRSEEFLQQIEDFREVLGAGKDARKRRIELFHRIYRSEGTINNAVSKQAALVAPRGSFKVHSVKGQRGKSGDKKAEEFQTLLNWWANNVNASALDGVMTGDRGISSFVLRGARLALITGDHIGRTVWKNNTEVPRLGSYSLPMNIQTFPTQHIEIPDGLEGTSMEIMYWVPPREFIRLLEDKGDPNVKKALDQLLDSKVRSALIKDGRYFLDPALLIHVRNRGTGTDNWGESIIECTMADVRYKRALDSLELTTIENLINRLVILAVGSDDHNSIYHAQEVSASRLGLLQRMMRRVGPAATLLWAGPDIKAIEVGAYNSILELDGRYTIAERRLRTSLGVPSVLLTGEGIDGKAAGWAAALGVAAQLAELQEQYVHVLQTIAERIAEENGFEEVEVVWEFHDNLLENREAAAEIIMKLFQLGAVDIQTLHEELGFDHGAIETRMQEEVSKGYRDEPFGPPKGRLTANPTGLGGEDGTRPTKEENPSRDPREDKETKTTEENS